MNKIQIKIHLLRTIPGGGAFQMDLKHQIWCYVSVSSIINIPSWYPDDHSFNQSESSLTFMDAVKGYGLSMLNFGSSW